jgi:hypothetical protein
MRHAPVSARGSSIILGGDTAFGSGTFTFLLVYQLVGQPADGEGAGAATSGERVVIKHEERA